ncbi:MAG: peptidylprolyl isomerase [Pseudomonadota bacterium]
MKSLIASLMIGVSALALPLVAQEAETPDPATVLAEVNGTEITLGHVVALASRLPAEYDQVEAEVLYNGILDQLVQQQLLASTVNTETAFAQLSVENETRTVLASEALAFIASEAASEENILAAYEAEVEGYTATKEFFAAHILVETEEEATALIEMLDNGTDFAELAQEKSIGPSGPNGGELGWFGPGAMVPSFDAAVQEMEVGSVAGPIQTDFGWHVINLIETRDTMPPTLDQRYGALEEQLRQQAIEMRITQLEADGDVTRSDVEFDFTAIRDGSLLD